MKLIKEVLWRLNRCWFPLNSFLSRAKKSKFEILQGKQCIKSILNKDDKI